MKDTNNAEKCTRCNSPFLHYEHKHITNKGVFHTNCYQWTIKNPVIDTTETILDTDLGKDINVPSTPNTDWAELDWKLWIEVMEDYLMTAELGHLVKDQKAYKDEMRAKYAKLMDFIRQSHTSLARTILSDLMGNLQKLADDYESDDIIRAKENVEQYFNDNHGISPEE